ncbi:MAG: slipin family protein [Planctomycetota bacterium]|nr:slipin family protein [Planctomycetota bacterium]
MLLMRTFKILPHERGLLFREGQFEGLLQPGKHRFADPFFRVRVEKVNVREAWFEHAQLDVIVKSGRLGKDARVVELKAHERGIVWLDGRLERVLKPGRYVLWTVFRDVRVDVVDLRAAVFAHRDLAEVLATGAFDGEARAVDLKDRERALVWRDGRFERVLGRGLHLIPTKYHDVKVEVVDAGKGRFEHGELAAIQKAAGAQEALEWLAVEPGHAAVFFKDGAHQATLGAGKHAFWKDVGQVRLFTVDLREQVVDIQGQEIMTADKVTLRLNAVVNFRVADAVKAATVTDDYRQALYREAQLSLRAAIGTRDLDALLAAKDEVARELEGQLKDRATAFGLEVIALGIRDVILPGEMKDLLNKVTEAKKAAEAALITRREETAAMRMQANTAKVLEHNPTLMRLRELEVLEKVTQKANLTVMLGEKGLADRVVKLL